MRVRRTMAAPAAGDCWVTGGGQGDLGRRGPQVGPRRAAGPTVARARRGVPLVTASSVGRGMGDRADRRVSRTVGWAAVVLLLVVAGPSRTAAAPVVWQGSSGVLPWDPSVPADRRYTVQF